MSGMVRFTGSGIGARRDEIVRKMRYPAAGVVTIDADTLDIAHTRVSQGEFTREELATKLGIDVRIIDAREGT